MSNVVPFRKPHRLRLHCCDSCNAEVQAQWALALESHYSAREEAMGEMEPRMDTAWDRDDTEDDRGLW